MPTSRAATKQIFWVKTGDDKAMGALLVSWNQLVASFNIGYIMIYTATVLAMVASGFFVGK